jgi:hypothetical protein
MPVVLGATSVTGVTSITASGGNTAMSIDATGRVNMAYHPVFFATGCEGGTYASGSVWRYTTLQVNNGSYYAASNGRFTAPVAGMYLFIWTNIGGTSNTVYRYYARINGSNIRDKHLRLDPSSSGSAYGTNGVMEYLVSLAANDYFQIYASSDDNSNHYPYGNGDNPYPNFSGFLVC